MSKHGTRSRYVKGCRCRPCRDANTAYQNDYQLARRRAAGIGSRPPAGGHGTSARYGAGCRCPECRRAWTDYQSRRRHLRHAALILGLAKPAHGRETTYDNYRCRCGPCYEAKSAANRRNYERRRSA